MDNNIKALLHVQCALLAALCATHPDPEALDQAFDFHLHQVNEKLETVATTALVAAWSATFRKHIRPSEAPDPTA